MIRTKSVYSPIEPRVDGLRVLVSRFRGRGLPKDRYDIWMPSLGPSEALLRQILDKKISWAEFRKRYKAELYEDGEVDRRNRVIKNHGQKFTVRLLKTLGGKGTVTLMCQCAEDEAQCHRHVLRALVENSK